MLTWIPFLLFLSIAVALLLGYPVAFTLAGVSLWFAALGILGGYFDPQALFLIPERLFGTYSNATLLSVPLFIFMGVMLERTRIAEDLLIQMAKACRSWPAGLGISVVLVGALLAASTGIVGATVVTMGLISLPALLQQGYKKSLAAGTLCATGTLGQIIPPSIALVLLGDILSSAYQQSLLARGIFNAEPVSVGDLFAGAIVPGLMLVVFYVAYLVCVGLLRPEDAPRAEPGEKIPVATLWKSIFPPVALVLLVLGSIILGVATATEAAGMGAFATLVLAGFRGQLSWKTLREVAESAAKMTCMVFALLLGASIFSLVFITYGGKETIELFFSEMPGGVWSAVLLVMIVIFLLGFILDFIEITFVVVPLVAPALLMMGVDPIWLGVMIAVNLQTSFLTPPFGFALFYLRGVAPPAVTTVDIYRGVAPFVIMQLFLLVILAVFPILITGLPGLL